MSAPSGSGSAGTERYDARTIVLHWITAGTVAVLWILGQTIDDFAKGMPRTGARTVHILLGASLAILLVARIIWRLRGGRRLALAAQAWYGKLERVAQWLLYALLIATVSLGIANAWIRGDTLLGLFKIPSIAPGNKELKETVEDLHALAANTVVVAALLHAVAALFHHFVLKDGLLNRMRLRKGAGG